MDAQSQVIAGLVVGYLMQWARGIKRIPDPLVYALAAAGGGLIYWLGAPADAFAHGPRAYVWGMVAFLFTIRGVAGASADAKAAPKSNTL